MVFHGQSLVMQLQMRNFKGTYMKKIVLIVSSIFFTFSFFVNAEEIDDSQSQLLEIFGDEAQKEADDSFDALEILQESNDEYVQKNEEIIQDTKKKNKERNRKNASLSSFIGAGYNIPFNLNYDTAVKTSDFPSGISAHYITSYMYISGKANLNWDFQKYTDNTAVISGATFSLGLTPIHNEYCFIGLYGTFGTDKINDYSYTAYGASATVIFNIAHNFGLLINCDATHRSLEKYNGTEDPAPYPPHFLNSWRICPSIGITYRFMNG